MAGKYTEEELAGLTDEEREALLEDDEELDEQENQELGEDGGDVDSEDDTELDADDSGAEHGDDDDGAVADADAGEQADAADEDEGAPVYTAQQPEDVETKLTELNAKKEELASKFDDGDITAKDYQKQLDALNKQEREIEREVFKAQLAQEMEQQRQKNEWARDVKDFLGKHPEYSKSKVLYGTLDNLVKEIARDPSNVSLSGSEILAKAHEQVQEALGVFGVKQQPELEQKPVSKAKAAKKARPELPPTLGTLPAAEINDTAGGKFAVLDRMADADPIRFEEELGKLSEAERERYLAQA